MKYMSEAKIELDLDEIKQLLIKIADKVDDLEKRVSKIETSAENMDQHIGFVEEIYEGVKRPFHLMMSYVGMLEPPKLKEITQSSELNQDKIGNKD